MNDPKDALRAEGLAELPLLPAIGAEGFVVWRNPVNPNGPGWLTFARACADGNIPNLTAASSASLIFTKHQGRWFVVALGYGRALLDPDKIEPRFGLRATINAVDAEQLTSLDVKTYEGAKFQIRRQAAGKTPLDSFGLNIRRDIVSAVAGIPPANAFAKSLAGRDSLTISTTKGPTELASLCAWMWATFSSSAYKERFGWIDELRPISDRATIAELDERLVGKLKAKDTDLLDLAAPEIVDPERLTGFRYPASPATELESDLDIDALLETWDGLQALTLDDLKSKRISVYRETDTAASDHWPIYKCLVAEFDAAAGNRSFVLTGGEWFEASKGLVEEVNEAVGAIDRCVLAFPAPAAGMDEEAYNKHCAATMPNTICLDRQLINVGGAHGSVEACDLLTREKYIIHVKRKTRSSTLSHLYAQAEVSAELVRRDKEFRKAFRAKAKSQNQDFQDVIKLDWKRDAYEVVLAILAKDGASVPTKLPFFARMQLRSVADRLIDSGYAVTIAGITEAVTKATKPKLKKKAA